MNMCITLSVVFDVMSKKYVLDQTPEKVWSLNQLKPGEFFIGIPSTEFYENKKNNKFIKLMLDAGYSTLHIYFLIFSFPEQKILNSKYNNSFELVKFYREVNGEGIDDGINQLHNINWQEIIDWVNSLRTLKIQVVSKNMNGFRNIRFITFTTNSLAEEVGFQKWIL